MPSTPAEKKAMLPTPAVVSETVQAAFAGAGVEAVLSALHAFELTVTDNMEWPWMRWRLLRTDDPAYLDGFPSSAPVLSDNPLSQTILSAALAMRTNSVDADTSAIKNLFEETEALLSQSETLPARVQFELMFIAYHERRWALVQQLVCRLLGMPISPDPMLSARIDALLLETLFFCTYRPYMPHYVDNPTPLLEKLELLLAQPSAARVMEARGMAAKTIEANLLAMRGQFDEALALYGDVAAANGFRSPVFQQTQVLLPLTDLSETTRAEDMDWYKSRSQTSFHFTHKPEGEHAIVVAVEPDYFARFGALYAEIVGTTNPGALIHFHLINFDDQSTTVAVLNSMAAKANVRINHTFEDNALMANEPRLKGGVCVNTRYIYLPDYLAAYGGVTITDVDGWLTKSMDALANFGDRDSLVSSWIWKKNTGYWRLPWGNLSGGYCSIKSSPVSRRFAALVAHYLSRLFARNAETGKPLFYADQAAHFLCLKKAEADWGMNVGFVGGGFNQADELAFGDRHSGKEQAMREKLTELQNASGDTA